MPTRFLRPLVVAGGLFAPMLGCSNLDPSADPDASDVAVSAESLRGGSPIAGALLFFDEFPGTRGNGRACQTCHVAADAFQLTPAHVEARWQALQAKKRRHPHADDPLFRAIDADDHDRDFTLLREHALVRVVIQLPTDEHGNKLVWPVDDPEATSVELFRATPSIRDSALTAPYQYDGRFPTLQAQALGALHAHAEIEREPARRRLDDVAAFQRTQFSSPRVAACAKALERGAPLPDHEPRLDALEQRGKELFARHCEVCHGGPALNQQIPELAAIAGVRDIFLSRPVPPFAADLPFAPSPVQNKQRTWAVRVPNEAEPVLRESTDPGIILQTGTIDNFNEFDIPSLLGIEDTAPYFRDNSAAGLREVLRQYQLLFQAVRRIVPPEVPFPLRPDELTDADFEPLIAYLRTL